MATCDAARASARCRARRPDVRLSAASRTHGSADKRAPDIAGRHDGAMRLSGLSTVFDPHPALPASLPDDLSAVESVLGGVSLNGGLFRWFDASAARQWGALLRGAFPSLSGRVQPFAADWLGRQFAIDSARHDADGTPQVLLLDVGAGEVLDVPTSLRGFHEEELVEFHDAALASNFYEEWRFASQDREPLMLRECVGYKVPLFLGGEDATPNLHRTDAEVHWTLTGQLLRQAAP